MYLTISDAEVREVSQQREDVETIRRWEMRSTTVPRKRTRTPASAAAKSRAAVPRKGTRSRKEQRVHRTHTDDWLDALFGEEHREPQHHGGDEHPAETRRARSIELTRKAFLARLIRLENNNG